MGAGTCHDPAARIAPCRAHTDRQPPVGRGPLTLLQAHGRVWFGPSGVGQSTVATAHARLETEG